MSPVSSHRLGIVRQRYVAVFLWVTLTCAVFAQNGSKPITEHGLTEALRIGGLSQKELVAEIHRRGVNFKVTSDIEKELQQAGAGPDIISAAQAAYRPLPSGEAPVEPVPQPITPSTPPDPAPSASPLPASHHAITTLHDVHRIYIEKMPSGLDDYLRAAISKKFGTNLVMVLDRSDADAVMKTPDRNVPKTVTMEDLSGKVVLWSGSAGDQQHMFLDLKHGGERVIAEKLAGQLKKAME